MLPLSDHFKKRLSLHKLKYYVYSKATYRLSMSKSQQFEASGEKGEKIMLPLSDHFIRSNTSIQWQLTG